MTINTVDINTLCEGLTYSATGERGGLFLKAAEVLRQQAAHLTDADRLLHLIAEQPLPDVLRAQIDAHIKRYD